MVYQVQVWCSRQLFLTHLPGAACEASLLPLLKDPYSPTALIFHPGGQGLCSPLLSHKLPLVLSSSNGFSGVEVEANWPGPVRPLFLPAPPLVPCFSSNMPVLPILGLQPSCAPLRSPYSPLKMVLGQGKHPQQEAIKVLHQEKKKIPSETK
jgi:hypothetical protein